MEQDQNAETLPLEFPHFYVSSTLEMVPITGFCVFFAPVLWGFGNAVSKHKHSPAIVGYICEILACLLLMPVIYVFASLILRDWQNIYIRRRWIQSYKNRISFASLSQIVAKEPERYILHVKRYGGLDRVRIAPAYVLEDRQTKLFSVISPSRGYMAELSEKYGVRLVKH